MCDECGSRTIKKDGLYVCEQCGLVCETVLEDSTYQLGNVVKQDNRTKQQYTAVNNHLGAASSLGTSIGAIEEYFFRDVNGNMISKTKQQKFRKFKSFYHVPVALQGKETDHRVFKILENVCSQHHISEQTRYRAVYLYKKYQKEKAEKITNHVLLSAMCLLLAIREQGRNCPITLREMVSTYEKLGHRVMGKNLLGLMQDLNVKMHTTKIRRSEEYIARICASISTNDEIKKRLKKKYGIDPYVYENILQLLCFRILQKIPNKDRGGRRPLSFAAASAYVADKLFAKRLSSSSVLTQKLVSKSTKVAEFTIRDHAEFIYSYNHQKAVDQIYKKLSSNWKKQFNNT